MQRKIAIMKINLKFISMVATATFLFGCTTPMLHVTSKPTDFTVVHPNAPTPVHLQAVKFKIINKDNVESVIADQIKATGNTNPTFVATSLDGYKVLMLNIADLRRYIKQQQVIIKYYEKTTTPK
jgi:hypothetical protein